MLEGVRNEGARGILDQSALKSADNSLIGRVKKMGELGKTIGSD